MRAPDKLHTPEGVWCRECGEFRCLTVQSRHAKEGIIRLRRCTACGKHYRTRETFYSYKYGSVCDDFKAVARLRRKNASA